MPVVFDPAIGDVALVLPDSISLNPTLLKKYPPKAQLFWFAHECAHKKLATGNEEKADCGAAKLGKDQGWFTSEADLDELAPFMNAIPADSRHEAGIVRMTKIRACYRAAP
jgi:hypothetical protein